jgi:hypothetical protein
MLPPGYALTGGGALLDEFANNEGVLLTDCRPAMKDGVYTGWTANGKAHGKADQAYATAWAIGIRPKSMPAGSDPKPAQVMADILSSVSHPTLPTGLVAAGDKEVVTGGGAAVTYQDFGGLLFATYPANDGKTWQTSAKCHQKPDILDLTTWSIRRTGEVKTLDAVRALAAGR